MAEKTFLDVLSDGFDAAQGSFTTYLDFDRLDTETDLANLQRTADNTAARQAAPALPAPTLDGLMPILVIGGLGLVGAVLLFKVLK